MVLGEFSDVSVAVVLTMAAVGAMGVGNGVILQLASEWFPKQIGLASDVIRGGRWDRRLSLAPLVGDAERGDRVLSNRVVGICYGYGHCLGHGAPGRTTSTQTLESHGSGRSFFSLTVSGQKNNVKCAMLNDKLIAH